MYADFEIVRSFIDKNDRSGESEADQYLNLHYNNRHIYLRFQPDDKVTGMNQHILWLTVLLLSSFGLRAENDSVAKKERSYHGDIELGGVVTTGNTETFSAKSAINVEQDFEFWRTHYVVNAQYQRSQFKNDLGEKERKTTEQQVFLSYQGNYKLAKENQSFLILGSYNDERFNGYNYQVTAVMGYGWRFLETSKSTIDIEIGPGYSWNELNDGTKKQGTIFHGAFKYQHQLTVATRFKQEIVTDASFNGENSKTKIDSSFLADINGRLAMRVSFFVEYNTKPDEGIKNLDTETGITLVYSF